MKMSKFNKMNDSQLRAYVLAHRQDEEAWYVFKSRIQEDPNTIRVMPNLDEAGWAEVERKIQDQARRESRL